MFLGLLWYKSLFHSLVEQVAKLLRFHGEIGDLNTILSTRKDTIYLTADALNALCLAPLLGFHVGLVVNAYIGGLGEINKVEMVDISEVIFLFTNDEFFIRDDDSMFM